MSLFVRGIPQTKAALERVRLEIAAASPVATKAGGEIVARDMVARAPRDTGALASSIAVNVVPEADGATASVGPSVPYARFTEFGTVYVTAQHFTAEAAEGSESGIVTAMASIYKAAIH